MWTRRGIFVVAETDQAVWRQVYRLNDGRLIPLSNDTHAYEALTGLPDGTLVAIQRQRFAGVSVAPANRPDDVRPVTRATGRYAYVSWLNSGSLLTQAAVSGRPEVWLLDAENGGQRNLTADSSAERNVRSCADGKYIVFSSHRSGSWKIWRADADGSNALQLLEKGGEEGSASCFPDGKSILFNSSRSAKQILWRVGIDGGVPQPITNELSYFGEVSPDGRSIACTYLDSEARRLGTVAVIDANSGKPTIRFPNIPTGSVLRWAPDGRALTWIWTRGGVSNLISQSVTGGPERELTHFLSDQLFAFEWSPDGRKVAYVKGAEARDAVLITTQ